MSGGELYAFYIHIIYNIYKFIQKFVFKIRSIDLKLQNVRQKKTNKEQQQCTTYEHVSLPTYIIQIKYTDVCGYYFYEIVILYMISTAEILLEKIFGCTLSPCKRNANNCLNVHL